MQQYEYNYNWVVVMVEDNEYEEGFINMLKYQIVVADLHALTLH